MSLLQLNKIVKEFGDRTLLNQVSLNVEAGERVALIGANGSGKSTLLRISMNKEPMESGQIIIAKGIKIGYLSQHSDELIKGDHTPLYLEEHHKREMRLRNLESELANPELLESKDEYERILSQYETALHHYETAGGYTLESMIKKTLLGLGLTEDALERPLESLSGGERIRVAMARILMDKPDLLILDEPTNHLDLTGIEWLEDYLLRFQGGVLLVSHDRYFLDRVSTRTAELSHGQLLVKSCTYTSFMEQKKLIHAYYEKENKHMHIRIRDKKVQIENLRKNNKIKQAKSRMLELKRMEKERDEHKKLVASEHLSKNHGPKLKITSHGHISKKAAWGNHVTKQFNDRVLFRDISFEINGGEKVALIGSNGCGKSTLLKMLMKQDKDYSGELVLGNWLHYCYLGQSVSFENENVTILEEIIQKGDFTVSEAKRHLAAFEFYGNMVDTPLCELSGGERVRVYLSEIMLENPHCLILDEPTNHLDLASREAIEKAVNTFNGTVIAVSHDRYYLNHCVTKILAFEDNGLITFNGNYDRFKEKKSAVATAYKESVPQANHSKTTPKKRDTPSPKDKKVKIQDIEEDILTLEGQINMLHQKIVEQKAKHSDYQRLSDLESNLTGLYDIYASYEA